MRFWASPLFVCVRARLGRGQAKPRPGIPCAPTRYPVRLPRCACRRSTRPAALADARPDPLPGLRDAGLDPPLHPTRRTNSPPWLHGRSQGRAQHPTLCHRTNVVPSNQRCARAQLQIGGITSDWGDNLILKAQRWANHGTGSTSGLPGKVRCCGRRRFLWFARHQAVWRRVWWVGAVRMFCTPHAARRALHAARCQLFQVRGRIQLKITLLPLPRIGKTSPISKT